MRTEAFVALLALAGAAHAQPAPLPHYDLSVRIDGGELHGRAVLRSARGTEREVRWRRPVPADARGFHLPAGSGWYPELPGGNEDEGLASYRVRLDLPAGQVGVVPGTLLEEKVEAGRYRARFEFPHPSPGIDLMVGPYQVTTRELSTAGGKRLRLRTYFHAEVASLAGDYLDAAGGYLDLYEGWIGEYPFGEFSVVSSPTPTGYGMATLTYLGVEVLKLPFIRATSLGHEVLHNWWGNGVYVDYASGNWAEALTTFMADYAYKEREGAAAAREMRLAWLRDLAALPASADFPLREFVARTHSASQVVGYRKGAMLFLMLRDTLGTETFDAALRDFWREQRFRVAGWAELQRAFEQASGRDLGRFFAQWLRRSGLPRPRIAGAQAVPGEHGWRVRLTLAQDEPAYALAVPVVVRTEDGEESHVVALEGGRKTYELKTQARPIELALDPQARVLRRLGPGEAPPILRRVALDPATRSVFPSGALGGAARALAARLAEHGVRETGAAQPPGEEPLLVIGLHADVEAWLARHALAPRPASLAGKGSAQAWTVARAAGAPIAVVSGDDAAALEALGRPLPHYGAQSYVVFDGAKAIARGVWPSRPQTWRLER